MPQADIDHRQEIGPVRDQGERPTCLSHASSLAHEKSREITMALSPEYLHYFSTAGDISQGCDFPDVAQALSSKGQPIETDCSYSSTPLSSSWRPPKGLEVFCRESRHEELKFMTIEEAIRAGAVPVLGISIPDPFFQPSAPWVIDSLGEVRGLHAVAGVGVGAEGANKAILIRNSWGGDWGESGHAWLDEKYLNKHLKAVMVLTNEVFN